MGSYAAQRPQTNEAAVLCSKRTDPRERIPAQLEHPTDQWERTRAGGVGSLDEAASRLIHHRGPGYSKTVRPDSPATIATLSS
jgi:hypothetical protein